MKSIILTLALLVSTLSIGQVESVKDLSELENRVFKLYWRSGFVGYDNVDGDVRMVFEPNHAYVTVKNGKLHGCNKRGTKVYTDKEYLPEGYWVRKLDGEVSVFGFTRYTIPEIGKYERFEFAVRKEMTIKK